MSASQVHRQRFIAYALMGYLDFLRRTRTADVHINYTFGGRGTLEPKMERAVVRQEVIDLVGIVDEFELALASGDEDWDKTIPDALKPAVQYLLESCSPAEGVLTPVEVLLETAAASRNDAQRS